MRNNTTGADGEDVDLTTLPYEVPTPVGLLVGFSLGDGSEDWARWVVSFGHYPDDKYPCDNGDWALVTRYEDVVDDGPDYLTLERSRIPKSAPR